jgi:hypothetical protein
LQLDNAIGLLDGTRCHVQIDIGFGDAVVPGPLKPIVEDLRLFLQPLLKVISIDEQLARSWQQIEMRYLQRLYSVITALGAAEELFSGW